MIEICAELDELLEPVTACATATVKVVESGTEVGEAGTTAIETLNEAEDASSCVDDVAVDAQTVLEPGADLPPTAEEIGPLYRTLEASEPTIHAISTDLRGVVIALGSVSAFLAVVLPILERRKGQAARLSDALERTRAVNTQLQRRYTTSTLPAKIASEVQALNACLRPMQAQLTGLQSALASLEGHLERFEVLKAIGALLGPVHAILEKATGPLKDVKRTLGKIEGPLRRARKMYDEYKKAAEEKIKKALADAGFPTKKLEALARGLQNQIEDFVGKAEAPVSRLKSRVTQALPHLELDAVQRQIQDVDCELTRRVDSLLPSLQRFEKAVGQQAGIFATSSRRLASPRTRARRGAGTKRPAASV
jgi:chaperonin cofactor prefoldin